MLCKIYLEKTEQKGAALLLEINRYISEMKTKLLNHEKEFEHLQVIHDMLDHSGDFIPSFLHEFHYNYRIDDD